MSTKKKVNVAKGRRYTQAEKADILAYVDQVNAQKGRGGQSAASKKFKISPLTISSWIRSGVGGASGLTVSASTASVSGPIGKKLAKLQALHDQISRMEKELSRMKVQFNALKSAL
jgi:transposase-like protein